jgi:hypothetical protein
MRGIVASAAAAGLACGGALGQALPFEDGFDSYAAGSFPCGMPGCGGPGGWHLWWYDYGQGPRPAEIVTGNAHSGTKAVVLRPYTDIVKEAPAGSGRWVVTVWSYFPSALTGAEDMGYLILLNECERQPPIRFSLLLLFEGASGRIKNTLDHSLGSVPMIRDRWVEVRVELDLTRGKHSVYYDGRPFYEDRPYGNGGAPVLECVAFFSDGVDGMLFDTVSVAEDASPPPPAECYANCDQSTVSPTLDIRDFHCFMSRFTAGDAYTNCDGSTMEPTLNVADFVCFMQRFTAGCPMN